MENASKALVMAGGVLIAVLILGMFIYTYRSMSQYFTESEQIEVTEQLTAFNKQYESYHRNLLRGTDVISVINKAIDNNSRYATIEPMYEIQVEFQMAEALVYKKDGSNANVTFNVGQRYNISSFSQIKQNADAFTDFKRRIFDCKEVKYSDKTGRVNYMLFVERKLDQEEYQYSF